jgi:hypothetical protein
VSRSESLGKSHAAHLSEKVGVLPTMAAPHMKRWSRNSLQ